MRLLKRVITQILRSAGDENAWTSRVCEDALVHLKGSNAPETFNADDGQAR